jgi:uncharacterized protein (DUF1501 family)
MKMKRRQFIQRSGVVTLPLLLGGTQISAITGSSLAASVDPDSDRVLILVQLNGGNDGLNTLIPLDQYANLAAVRKDIIVPEDSLLGIRDDNAFHPSMPGFQSLYEQELLGIIQGVGYPDQNRSHFRSTDIWTSGSHSDEFLTSGWLGRALNVTFPDYPEGYPSDEHPDPFAITLGFVVSETCQGPASNYSYTLADPTGLVQLDEPGSTPVDNSCYGQELAYIKTSIAQSNAYASTVSEAYERGTNHVDYAGFNTRNSLHEQLRIVARLIDGGLQTKVYVVSMGGFDNHADQVVFGDTTTGDHANLLAELSDAVAKFQTDAIAGGYADRVVGMTFSEFGRRVRANGSLGTDHGTAAPLFVFGTCVQPAIIGANPVIDRAVDEQAGVPMQYDFRSVYGTMLTDWLGMTEADVRSTIYEDFQRIPFLKACESPVSTEELELLKIAVSVAPNPASDNAYIDFEHRGGHLAIQVMDVLGSVLDTVVSRRLGEGRHRVPYRVSHLASGQYFIRVASKASVGTVAFVKI